MLELIQQYSEQISGHLGVSGPLVDAGFLLALALVAHLAMKLFFMQLHRVAQATGHRWDDVVVAALDAPVRTIVWIIALYLALGFLAVAEPAQLQSLIVLGYDTALLVLLAWFLHRLTRGVEKELLREEHGLTRSNDKASIHATAKLLRIVLWVIIALMVMQSLGVSVSGLLAFGGVGGVAVGFAAKDLLANFFGALSIYLDRPFTTGDWIRSPDQEIEGTVEEVGWRLTRIRTFDQRPLYVPNATFSNISVENPSRMRNRRIYETIGIRYEDAHKMDAIVADVKTMLQQHKEIDLSRTLIVNFVSFGPSSLDFFIYTFTKTVQWVEFHEIKQDIMLRILTIIAQNGAEMAFPSRTVYLQPPPAEPEQ